MAEQYVMAGLVRKRAELAGKIEKTYQDLRQMVADLETTDKALALFDPDYAAETIKPLAFPPPDDLSSRGLPLAVEGVVPFGRQRRRADDDEQKQVGKKAHSRGPPDTNETIDPIARSKSKRSTSPPDAWCGLRRPG